MNVLFYSISDSPHMDGVSRVTNILATKLSSMGINVFLCHWFQSDIAVDKSFYKATLHEVGFGKAGIEKVLSFMQMHHIDIFVNPLTANYEMISLLKAIRNRTSVQIVTVLHTSPLWYEGIKTFYRNFKWPEWFKKCVFEIYKTQYMRPKFKRITRQFYNLSNAYVLLSEHFIDEFIHYNKISDNTKLCVINNPIEFNENESLILPIKERLMLYVGRLENTPKRIDRVLKIWKEFHVNQDGWRLMILGDGKDKDKLEAMANEMHLTDVFFKGRVIDVNDYYQRAKILFVTSDYEGWPMSIVEGMRWGGVPVAYDTFSSLHDIICNGDNGFIVSPDNVSAFIDCLHKVEANYVKMSQSAQASVIRFSVDCIVERWLQLFQGLLNKVKLNG